MRPLARSCSVSRWAFSRACGLLLSAASRSWIWFWLRTSVALAIVGVVVEKFCRFKVPKSVSIVWAFCGRGPLGCRDGVSPVRDGVWSALSEALSDGVAGVAGLGGVPLSLF